MEVAQNTQNTQTTTTSVPPEAGSEHRKRRPPRQNKPAQPSSDNAATKPPRRHRPRNDPGTSSAVADGTVNTGNTRPNPKPRNPRRAKPNTNPVDGAVVASGESAPPAARKEGNRRRQNFGSGLTQPDQKDPDASTSVSGKQDAKRGNSNKGKAHLPQGDDLSSTLIRNLSTPPYPDCPICFSAIRPEQAIWSCSPSIPIVTSSEAQVQQYCWTSFHIKCIRSWAEKSVKEVADAWRARGEPDRKGDWRCPGCQAKREAVPSGYWCFCNSTNEPKPLRLSTPHSCGNSCSRPRESACGHPCPLQCHPGPCPPCQVTTRLECYCPRKTILPFRCGIDVRGKGIRDLSCGKTCERTLNCGKHACEKTCHVGDCGKCPRTEVVMCWCGKETKTIACGEGKDVECFVDGETPWIGRFGCDNICKRSFDCGKHECQKLCHPPSSKPATCPRSPLKITHCPCGKRTIAPSPSSDTSQYTFPARVDCTDPIPTCDSVCSKPHIACSHPCTAKCHNGPCPPCTVQIVRPCRCGAITKSMACYEVHRNSSAGIEEKEILCDKPCQAIRACGRHQCNRLCCPLASLAIKSGKKGKRRAIEDSQGIGEEQGGLHECDLVCGKMLSCGNHRCEEKDHKGTCRPCLRSSFEELICFCGRTVYEPPIPCGTKMVCHYPCPRQTMPCGHPPTPHSCHDDTVPCPPCVFLASKQCACGKKIVPNVRCSLETEKVSCGTVCGKLMSCGFHHCERLCHGDECGPCTAPCGKSRKSCLPNHHPCTRPCHAPSSCLETEPCQATIVISCSCGRIQQSVPCGRTSSSSRTGPSQPAPKCTNDCKIAKRNAMLADALGINTEGRDKNGGTASYNDEVVNFARANIKFLPIVEKAFADFISSEKKTQVLPHMPPDRRKFVHDLAAVYRMDTQMVDQEPHRSVQLLRRIDTRLPTPILSNYLTTLAPQPSLGKLADFRTLKAGSQAAAASSWRSGIVTPPSKPTTPANASQPASGAHRGWTSVVSNPAPQPAPPASTTSWAPRPVPSSSVAASSTIQSYHSSQIASNVASINSRTASPATVQPTPSNVVLDEQVPDNWEDDV